MNKSVSNRPSILNNYEYHSLIENSNIDINQRSISITNYPVMNNYECLCLSPF